MLQLIEGAKERTLDDYWIALQEGYHTRVVKDEVQSIVEKGNESGRSDIKQEMNTFSRKEPATPRLFSNPS